jgi:S-disulfanyl-L-cysteine oxidoreductase SoxD
MNRSIGHLLATCSTALATALMITASIRAQGAGTQQSGSPSNSVWSGVFSTQQASRGKASFDGVCARCHGAQLAGGVDGGPTLKGSTFLSHWNNDTLASLYVKIRDTMPRNSPGTISDEVKIEILAYLLQQNGFPTGTAELRADLPTLDEVHVTRKGVWDGVFTAAQADRGKTAASQGRCTGCHGPELGGTERAPALKGAAFLANWEDGSVNRLFAKIRDGMPPGNTDQLSAAAKLDVVTFLLRENGFPTGSVELPSDADALDSIQIVKKGADSNAAPNFALVQVIGCLADDRENGWMLTDATEPIVTRDDMPTAAALKNAEAKPLGRQTLRLVSVGASLKAESLKGAKVEARGLLYREPAYADLNLTSLTSVTARCRN